MHRITPTLLILLFPVLALGQDNYGFPFGQITYAELDATAFPADTSADAYVIREVAEAHVDYETNSKIIFTYHAKIKILKQSAARRGDVRVYLEKNFNSPRKEEIRSVQASSYNVVNNRIEETKVDSRDVFTERNDKKYKDVAKFAIPNVRAGTVIEYQYIVESPFLYNFKKWEFQSDIPKQYSEYRTVIPGNYVYNITLRGSLELNDRKDDIIRDCVVSGNGASASCAATRYIMKDIPAFREEEYMIAKENYMSAINFELSELRDWDGRVNKFTKEWKDADEELRQDEQFGQQLRKNRDAFEGRFDASILTESDPLNRARKVYDLVKFGISWNEYKGYLTNVGIKKAVEGKKGSVGDINLALVAALRQAGFNADPVLLATRDRERPIEIHPVLADFNYVIVRLSIGDKIYLLDAVDDFLPFGLISEECYNGKGRVIAEGGSYWMDIKPTDRNRIVTQINFKLSNEGSISGTVTNSFYGYAAVEQRKTMSAYNDEKNYTKAVIAQNHNAEIKAYSRTLDDDLSKAVSETFTVEMDAFGSPTTTHYLFSPFFNGKMETNPFKTEYRTFPVDFGVPIDRNLIVIVEYPDNIEVTSLPDKVGLALPNAGGRYIYAAQADGTKLSISNMMTIAKPIYMPEEYPYLRELYARKIQAENADIIFQRKK